MLERVTWTCFTARQSESPARNEYNVSMCHAKSLDFGQVAPTAELRRLIYSGKIETSYDDL